MTTLHSIAEFVLFKKLAKDRLTEEQLEALRDHLMAFPQAGDVIPRSGGCRKLRWEGGGHGRRGGSRIITYYHSENRPLYLIMIYLKSEQADLTPTQVKYLYRTAKELKS